MIEEISMERDGVVTRQVVSTAITELKTPPEGKYPWEVRAGMPGLDDSSLTERVSADNPLAAASLEDIRRALAVMYDRLVCYRLGLCGLNEPIPNLEAMIVFAFAACGELSRYRELRSVDNDGS